MKSFFLLLVLIPISLQIEHCLIERLVCKKCKTGYFLSEGKCNKIKNCNRISYDGNTCEQCENGYRPDNGNTLCVPIGEDHCYAYTAAEDGTTQICQTCQTGYKKKEDNTCELVVEHCANSELVEDNLVCHNCEEGYAINSAINKCIEFPKCTDVDADGKCIKCDDDDNEYLHPNQEGNCVFDICEKYNDEWECTKCADYFYLNNEGKCKYIEIPYCKKLDEENKNQCDDTSNFLKDRDPAEYEIAKQEYLTRCNRKNDDGSCAVCDDGDYEIDSTGKKCILTGCEALEEPSSKCEFCEHGYILVDDGTRCMSISEALEKSESEAHSGTEALNSISKLNRLLFLILLFLI